MPARTRRSLRFLGLALVLAAGCQGTFDEGPSGFGARRGDPTSPTTPTTPTTPTMPTGPSVPGGRVLRRISEAEYVGSVRDVLEVAPTESLPADPRYLGLSRVGGSVASVSPLEAEQYETVARQVALEAFRDASRAARIAGCDGASVADATCARAAIGTIGARLFRRPLTTVESDLYTTLALAGAAHVGTFDGGLALAVSGMLQSPRFLFHVEEGLAVPGSATRRQFTGFEMAARLASFLWNSVPDEALLDLAARGGLDTEDGVRTQVRAMLLDARARTAVVDLFAELFELQNATHVGSGVLAPTLSDAMIEETRRVLEVAIFDEPTTRYRDLFDRSSTFVNAELAAHYGLTPPGGTGFARVELPVSRRGILSHASVLVGHGHGATTSPTLRGRFVRTRLLCANIAPPPAGVSLMIDAAAGPTARDRLAVHATSPACAGCHSLMDPIGLAFEQFDGVAAFRTLERGATIDPSGELDGVPFEDATSLGEVVRDHPALDACLVRQLYRAAVGREEAAVEASALDALTREFASDGGRVLGLIEDLAASEGNRFFEVTP